jgi:hypothetical protein
MPSTIMVLRLFANVAERGLLLALLGLTTLMADPDLCELEHRECRLGGLDMDL